MSGEASAWTKAALRLLYDAKKKDNAELASAQLVVRFMVATMALLEGGVQEETILAMVRAANNHRIDRLKH